MRSNSQFTLFVLAVCVGGTATLVRGQEAITYSVWAEYAKPGSEPSVSPRFREAEARISQGAYDPAADSLLRGAERLTKVIFNVPSLQLQGAITERVYAGVQRGDVLIAEWRIQEPFGRGMLVLTDTRYYSNYDLRLAACMIRSRTDLTTFLNTALIWGKDPGISPRAQPSRDVPTPGMTVGIQPASASLSSMPTSFGGHRTRVWRTMISRDCSKTAIGSFISGSVRVELSATLASRRGFRSGFQDSASLSRRGGLVKSEAIGDAVQAFGYLDFTGSRDAILIAEHVRRGISGTRTSA